MNVGTSVVFSDIKGMENVPESTQEFAGDITRRLDIAFSEFLSSLLNEPTVFSVDPFDADNAEVLEGAKSGDVSVYMDSSGDVQVALYDGAQFTVLSADGGSISSVFDISDFPADPGTDGLLKWNDGAGTLEWDTSSYLTTVDAAATYVPLTHLTDYDHGDIAHANRASLDLVSGTNTGDQDLWGYVPYIGATSDVNLGANDLYLQGEGTKLYFGADDNIHMMWSSVGTNRFEMRGSTYPWLRLSSLDVRIGYRASENIDLGSVNTVVGAYSFFFLTTGDRNVAIGTDAGSRTVGLSPNYTTEKSVFIGGYTKSLSDGGTNEIVIGYEAIGHGSNSATIGNSSVTALYTPEAITMGDVWDITPGTLTNLTEDDDIEIQVNDGGTNTTAIRVHGDTGIISFPEQAFLQARKTTDQYIYISSWTVFIYNYEDLDTQGEYDNVNGIYTAKEDGVRDITASVLWQSVGAGKEYNLGVSRNDSLSPGNFYRRREVMQGAAAQFPQLVNVKIWLNSGDTVRVFVSQNQWDPSTVLGNWDMDAWLHIVKVT